MQQQLACASERPRSRWARRRSVQRMHCAHVHDHEQGKSRVVLHDLCREESAKGVTPGSVNEPDAAKEPPVVRRDAGACFRGSEKRKRSNHNPSPTNQPHGGEVIRSGNGPRSNGWWPCPRPARHRTTTLPTCGQLNKTRGSSSSAETSENTIIDPSS